MFYKLLADSVVAVHLAYVAFVVLAQALIVVGLLCRRQWVRNLRFRVVHLVMVEAVALEGWFGIICPMTDWDKQLRLRQTAVDSAAVQPAEPKSEPKPSAGPPFPQTIPTEATPMPMVPMPMAPMPMAPMPMAPMPMAPTPEPSAAMPVGPQAEPEPPPAPVAREEPPEDG